MLNLPPCKSFPYGRVQPFLFKIGLPAERSLKRCIEMEGYVKVGFALEVLVGVCGDAVFEYVFDLFKWSTDPEVRGFCVYVFRFFSPDLAVPALLYAMDNRLDDECLGDVVLSLASIRDERVVEPLVRALYDGDEWTDLYAVLGLGNIFSEEAVEALRHAKGHGDPEIRAYARMMLHNKGKPYLTATW